MSEMSISCNKNSVCVCVCVCVCVHVCVCVCVHTGVCSFNMLCVCVLTWLCCVYVCCAHVLWKGCVVYVCSHALVGYVCLYLYLCVCETANMLLSGYCVCMPACFCFRYELVCVSHYVWIDVSTVCKLSLLQNDVQATYKLPELCCKEKLITCKWSTYI